MAPFYFGTGGNSVLVYTAKNQYHPGECIQGFASVNIVSSTNFEGLFVKFSGKERLRFDDYETIYVPHTETYTENGVTRTRTTTRAHTYRVDRFGKHTLFKVEFMLLAGGYLTPGQYTVPFNFLLPMGLPGSFYLEESGFECGVEYGVKAHVRVPGLLKSDLRSVYAFQVSQSPPNFSRSITASANSDIDVFCCFNRGNAQLSFRCTRDTFFSGESVNLVASATNNSTADLKRLTVKLRRYLYLKADSGHSKKFEVTISEMIYPGIPRNSALHEIPMSLNIPLDAPQQCFGAKIRCLYSVRLSGKVRCGTDATCTVPAFIYNQPPITPFAVTFDPSWHPVVMNPVEIVCSAPPAIPEPITLSQYPGADTMRPSAPDLADSTNTLSNQIPITPSTQIGQNHQALDGFSTHK